MFCIGKLASYKGNKGIDCYGSIRQICPPRKDLVIFHKEDVYKVGELFRHPEWVKDHAYVAYNLNQADKPELVVLLENVKHDSLFRLIRENAFTGEDIDIPRS